MEAFPIAIHNKIRRQKVTIAMATECRMGAPQRAGRALKEMQGSASIHPSRLPNTDQLQIPNTPPSIYNSYCRSLNFSFNSLNNTEMRPS